MKTHQKIISRILLSLFILSFVGFKIPKVSGYVGATGAPIGLIWPPEIPIILGNEAGSHASRVDRDDE